MALPVVAKCKKCDRGEEIHGDDVFRLAAQKAMDVAKANGAKVHPRVAAIKANAGSVR